MYLVTLYMCMMMVLGAVPSLRASVVPTGSKDYKYIGSHQPITSHGAKQVKRSAYFLSQNAAGWATARGDCRNIFGESAGLLDIETRDELNAVSKFLAGSDDTGTLYWLGGQFDEELNTFTWDSGYLLEAWAPWDLGHPETRNIETRVTLSRRGKSIKFRTKMVTESTRAICEVQK